MSPGGSIPVNKRTVEAKKCGKNIRRTLEAARKSKRHPISKLARGRRSDRDVLASGAASSGQPKSPCRDIVRSRGVAQEDASGHAKTKHTRERGTGGLIVQGHSEGGVACSDQYIPRRRGHLCQHQRNPHLGRIHCRARRNVNAAGPVSGPGQNWNPTATGKEHTKARALSGKSSLSNCLQQEKVIQVRGIVS